MIHRRHTSSPPPSRQRDYNGGGDPENCTTGNNSTRTCKANPSPRRQSFKRYALGVAIPAFIWVVYDMRLLHSRSGPTSMYPFPRTVRMNRDMPGAGSTESDNRVDRQWRRRQRKLDPEDVMQTASHRKALADSHDYDHNRRDSLWSEDCEPMHSWQEALFPSCSVVHEMGLGHVRQNPNLFWSLNDGGYNQVFVFHLDLAPSGEQIVLKVLKYGTEHTDRNFDRVRRDVLISERLTRSQYVVDVLGHCGLSQLAPLGVGGTMSQLIDNSEDDEMDDTTKLKLATVAALGLADLHNIDGDGVPSVTHGDLKNNQYMMVDGTYKLGDFNRGRFLRKNRESGEPCSYTIGKNDAKYRSPEEYRYDELTAKIDVWALGSTIFRILTGETVWHGYKTKKAQKKIASTNAAPPLPDEFQDSSNNGIHNLLREVMYKMCFVGDPEKRASAQEVADFLKEKAAKDFGIESFEL